MNSNFIKLRATLNKLEALRKKTGDTCLALENKCGKHPSFLAAAGSSHEIVVVLPYGVPHRSGF